MSEAREGMGDQGRRQGNVLVLSLASGGRPRSLPCVPGVSGSHFLNFSAPDLESSFLPGSLRGPTTASLRSSFQVSGWSGSRCF